MYILGEAKKGDMNLSHLQGLMEELELSRQGWGFI